MLLTIQPGIVNKDVPHNRLFSEGWERRDWQPREIVRHITKGGAICVASLTGDYRDEEHFSSAQIIGIDFDDFGPDVSYFKKEDPLAKGYAFFIGATSSSTPEAPRTRLLFALDQPVSNPADYKRLVRKLLYFYRHLTPDIRPKDAVRIFYGSQQPTFVMQPEQVLPLSVLEQLPDPPVGSMALADEGSKPIMDILTRGAPSGSRNNDALRLAGHLVNVLPPDEVAAIMKLWYDTLVVDKQDFDFPLVDSMVRRMADKSAPVLGQVRETVKRAMDAPVGITPQAVANVDQSFKTTSFLDFVGAEDNPVKWLIEECLPEDSTGAIVAPPESYKTWIALAMGVSVSTGEPLFGKYKVNNRGAVLVIQQEDSKGLLKQRLRLIYSELWRDKGIELVDGRYRGSVVMPEMRVFEGDDAFKFDNPKMFDNLEAHIAKHGTKLVIMDPLYSFTDASDYMAKDAQRMGRMKDLRRKYGCTFLVVHHTRKTTSESGIDRQDGWGSQFLNAWLEFGWQIRKKADGLLQVRVHFKVSAAITTKVLKVDISTEPDDYHFSMEIADDEEPTREENYEESVLAEVKKAPGGKLSATAIAKALGRTPSWASDGVGKKVLAALVAQGKLKAKKQGAATVYISTELADF